jgi:hypothetical protein
VSSSSQILILVTFSDVDLAPLTTQPETLTEDVERYLQRVTPGELQASVNAPLGRGFVRDGSRMVATFSVAPLGRAA